jgi:hypothetical protein
MLGMASGLGVDRGAGGEPSDVSNVGSFGEGAVDIGRYILTRAGIARDSRENLRRSRKTRYALFAVTDLMVPRSTDLFFDKALALAFVRIKPLDPTRDSRRPSPDRRKCLPFRHLPKSKGGK